MDSHKTGESSSQSQRALPALSEGYFNVDEMSFSGTLATAAAYARLVKFINAHNVEDGTWMPYFAFDETMVIASILAIDLRKAERSLERFLKGNAPAREVPTRELARAINGWYAALESAESEVGKKLFAFIESVQIKLVEEREALKVFLMQSGPRLGDAASFKSNFYGYAKAIELVRSRAAQLLPESLTNQRHDPSIGLLIAFAQLLQKLKTRADRYTQNHLDFYYRKVLQERERDAVPDSVYLVLQSNAAGRPVTVDKGTEFLAGIDQNKKDIIYSSDDEVLVHGARVAALNTLFFNRNRWSSPENRLTDHGDVARGRGERRKQYPTHGWLASIPARDVNAPFETELPRYPLLGAPKSETDVSRFESARIGFALASRALLLGEGQRDVTVTLKFDESSAFMQTEGGLEEWIKRLAVTINGEQETEHADTVEEDTFVKVFRRMFNISLTGARGWIDVHEYIPLYSRSDDADPVEKNSLVIRFSLRPEIEAVTAYAPAVHGEDYGTELPVIRFVMNPDGYLYPYGLLKNIALKEAIIDVNVRGCRNVMLYNNLGQLAPLGPFNPFGPIPVVGSWFIVGCAEAAGKQLQSFDVDIEWGGLPIGKGGFRTHYQGYEHPIENAEIQASVSVLTDGRWIHGDADAPPVVALFDSGDEEIIAKHRRLSCAKVISYFKPAENAIVSEEFAYTPASRNGFFKFTLASPDYAFAHKEYPVALARALTFNSRQKVERYHRPVPNEPYTPLVDSVAVNYRAQAVIHPKRPKAALKDARKDKLIHLHPLGWESIGAAIDGRFTLVPRYDYSANLFIGLQATEMTGTVTLLFHLHEDSLPMEETDGAGLRWFYLSNNRWKPLAENRVVSDSTQGFMTSGIVTLDIPDDIGGRNTVMPAGLFWLRVSTENDMEKFCSVYAIYAQAVRVTWQGDVSSKESTVLPAGSIKRARTSIPGIDAIVQVMPSFGGRAREDHEHLRTRVSERLKHKNRALTAWDYERLILERFPEIYRVKCFPNMVMDNAPEKRMRPGHILIVPLPHLHAGRSHLQPLLSGYLVNEVREFVSGLCPPFVTVDVRNPVYEQIQVRCSVKLKKGYSGGYYLNLLNQAISDFLSPWNEKGYSGDFGWHIRQHELESFVQALDYVDYVTHFSMLRITPDSADSHDLFDSATKSGAAEGRKEIVPKYPWSIAVPIVNHYIQTVQSGTPGRGRPAGIGELEVGSTFIISAEE